MDHYNEPATGYLSRAYAVSLAEFGTPRELRHCEGWVLLRAIPNSPYHDAMGCYPLFACRKWEQLEKDLDDIANDVVTFSLVTDPFGDFDLKGLRDSFQDVVTPFKEHFVVDLSQQPSEFVCSHHRRNAEKALRAVLVDVSIDATKYIDDWLALHSTLIRRHRIKGISAFSAASFEKQFSVPGLVVFRAIHNSVTVGMTLWYIQGEIGYYHLGAYNGLGYQLRSSFALFQRTLEYFKDKLQWLDLGAGAGVTSNSSSGLSRFKRGWSTAMRMAYFCGRICDHEKYRQLIEARGLADTDYFPAYRQGEFI